MDTIAYLIFCLWAIFTIGISLYNLGRVYFALTPVMIYYTYKEELVWYEGLNSNRAIIIVFYSSLSLFIALTYGVSVIKNDSWLSLIVNLFLNIIIQVGLMMIIENKMPHNLIQTIKNFCDKNYVYYPPSEIQENKSNIIERIFEMIQKINQTIIASENKIEKVLEQSMLIEIPFRPKVNENMSTSDIIKHYKISPKSANDVGLLRNGKEPKNPIIFTRLHSGKVNKKIIFLFFKDNFELIDYQDKKWIAELSVILEFINKYSTFETQDKDYLELNNDKFEMTADILSRYRDKI
ncbi:hypothetical protein EG346_02355 [Chryseobacterium carnipullorum]|uniref:Uncharacterized protein n=1 Tax=Chryseobacterium carnipullorum TaxID=1124835 RepID=A0A376EEQ3_CHRCU|nr:hypothetical protein [Chryseobacterium carnipullorum]AZA47108.1 hypothetical protein EG346_02355 [Chryseobacterium carnipullorum]AZA66459.1 hypothetical protein EG345_18485 [Chryseobacterium carnipullorum]STD07945.1 Uncharacterised protein [Chryseobacterium carnipullorum]